MIYHVLMVPQKMMCSHHKAFFEANHTREIGSIPDLTKNGAVTKYLKIVLENGTFVLW